MEKLTDKQIKARAYYAANAEKIKAQKRADYSKNHKKVKAKVSSTALKKNNNPQKINVRPVIIIENRKLSARERIENIRIEKELMALTS